MQSSASPALSNCVDPGASAECSWGLRGEGLSETSSVWAGRHGLSGYWGPQATADGIQSCENSRLRLSFGGETNSMRTEEELMEDYTGIYTTLSAIQVRDWKSVYS